LIIYVGVVRARIDLMNPTIPLKFLKIYDLDLSRECCIY